MPFERHLFRPISQSTEETVDQFVCFGSDNHTLRVSLESGKMMSRSEIN